MLDKSASDMVQMRKESIKNRKVEKMIFNNFVDFYM